METAVYNNILSEIAINWRVEIQRCMILKKHQFGGPIRLETRFFAPCLAKYLWNLLNFPYPNDIHLNGNSIELMNVLFGEGIYHTSGWCYSTNQFNESWAVNSIHCSFQLKDGLLEIVFNTERKNALGESFLVQ